MLRWDFFPALFTVNRAIEIAARAIVKWQMQTELMAIDAPIQLDRHPFDCVAEDSNSHASPFNQCTLNANRLG